MFLLKSNCEYCLFLEIYNSDDLRISLRLYNMAFYYLWIFDKLISNQKVKKPQEIFILIR
jgi:hypothetical protein